MKTREYIDNVRSFFQDEKASLKKICDANLDKFPSSFKWSMKQKLERGRFTLDGTHFCPRKVAHILRRAAQEEGIKHRRIGRVIKFSMNGYDAGATV